MNCSASGSIKYPASKFCKETFMNSHKTANFVKVFSLERVLLYKCMPTSPFIVLYIVTVYHKNYSVCLCRRVHMAGSNFDQGCIG